MQEERREYMVWNETGPRIIGRRCECGCGDVAPEGRRYVRGHDLTPANRLRMVLRLNGGGESSDDRGGLVPER